MFTAVSDLIRYTGSALTIGRIPGVDSAVHEAFLVSSSAVRRKTKPLLVLGSFPTLASATYSRTSARAMTSSHILRVGSGAPPFATVLDRLAKVTLPQERALALSLWLLPYLL
jgi:hypothetical protein